jgi:hypothetical protein
MSHPLSRLSIAAFASFSFTVALAHAAQAQRRSREPLELHGSKESVERMFDFAQSHRMPFYLTPTNVDSAIAEGKLVALTGDSTYELTRGVGFSYSTREAKQFVLAFAPQYLAACGVPLTVTSAARPMSRQPRNANPHSVHPTGIAVDIRRPPAGPCQTWVRSALTELERQGFVEATEEHHPVHIHLAVLVQPGGKVVLPNLVRTVVARQATTPVTTVATSSGDIGLPKKTVTARTYTVRQGDTMWDIANRSGVSMSALSRVNGRAAKGALRPGTTLTLPAER